MSIKLSRIEAEYIIDTLKEIKSMIEDVEAYTNIAVGVLDAVKNVDEILRAHLFNSELAELKELEEDELYTEGYTTSL